ncbi:unnamed protein product [Cunninghamella blakesleeana]
MEDFNFDDNVFTATIERKHIPLAINYQAKQEYDGWFHDFEDPRQLMLEKLGPVQLKSAIEHDYFLEKYEQSLERALLFIEITETEERCKMINTREMTEIAILSAAHLEKWDQVKELLGRKQTTYELGSLLIKGKFYPRCDQYGKGISALVEYNKQRKRDYAAWGLISDGFFNDATQYTSNNSKVKLENNMPLHLAHLAIKRCLRIMSSFQWRMDIPAVKKRCQLEKNKFELKCQQIEQLGGDMNLFLNWMKKENIDESFKSDVVLDDYQWDDLKWIYQEWVNHENDTDTSTLDDADNIKAVKDM